ncbi:MAG: methylenetetrahydrofolate reductase [NAD(P)H] [Trichococcus flocculiformis]|jgi:methylenetetrahydrofolate reductase (NADPH)|uniref:methylenetetrahydrofolate reductase [NAD(P)H] n=1 Tax=Trichococcus TaxID=82802 RepID=UPI000E7D7238|nr:MULTISPECIES: methylenetetrahydrofolate reductase [NAD(P)H] [Trichococcus]MBP6247828.1 methylenetetrahydrofolate reductase [NAD(P)H] [Trichococcus sp.]MBP7129369.1 methylenetetrahydrofolate reductase [NAD(P)H] [Trichococcus sp.]MDB6352743.1 methylenetetrahydrofolate reductase [NAD(P)H] [Trichococcus sp. K1Tr]HBQ63118.1 methylenetetrahydrofolate reductase [NAD(P)H] [Trichococcus sp.]HRG31189.1 methylenetetrahydrofolate reductase [NAD(P)H] [Trichococcus flocculiformis]
MKIESKFQKKKPVLSFEIFPPKRDKAIQNIDETLAILSELNPDFISVTFGAGGSHTDNQTVELAKRIKQQYGIDPLVHLTCLNSSKFEICELLEELKEAEIDSILALRGDKNPAVEEKQDFRYASDLVKFIRQYGDFSISGACYPECHTESKNKIEDIAYLKEKVDSGVQHLISQLFFDNNAFYSFQEHIQIAGMHVPVEAGIMPVINKAQIERMVTLCGASLPEKFSRVMHKYEDNKEALFDAGMAYAINQIVDLLAHDVDGIHIYTMNNPIVAKRICDGIKNLI